MLALVAAAATATPVFTAAASAVLPDVLDGDRYVLGRSVFSLTGSAIQIIGLGIGGAILAALPARRLLLAAGLAAAGRRRHRPPGPAAPAHHDASRTTRGIVRAAIDRQPSHSSATGPCAACCSRSGCPPGSSPAPSP